MFGLRFNCSILTRRFAPRLRSSQKSNNTLNPTKPSTLNESPYNNNSPNLKSQYFNPNPKPPNNISLPNGTTRHPIELHQLPRLRPSPPSLPHLHLPPTPLPPHHAPPANHPPQVHPHPNPNLRLRSHNLPPRLPLRPVLLCKILPHLPPQLRITQLPVRPLTNLLLLPLPFSYFI